MYLLSFPALVNHGYPFCRQSYPYDGVPGPFFGTEWPAATLVCHPECAPARSFAQGEAHAASAPHGLGNLRALPFFWSCKTPSSASGKSGRRRLTWPHDHCGVAASPSRPPRTAGKLRPSGPTAGVPLRNGGMAYTRPAISPHGPG